MKAMIFYLLTLTICVNNNLFAQELDTVITKTWKPNQPPNKESIVRPSNVAKHACLAESDEINFKVYFWMEYDGLVDSLNNIHKISMYEWDGRNKQEDYYMLIKGDPTARVDLNDYQVPHPLGRIMDLESKGIIYKFYLINYHGSELNDTDAKCYAKDKENYNLVTALSNSKHPNSPSPISPEYDVYIKVEKREGDLFSVVIQDDSGTFTKRKYKLVSKKPLLQIKDSKLPFFYYQLDSKRIYLLNGTYLDPI